MNATRHSLNELFSDAARWLRDRAERRRTRRIVALLPGHIRRDIGWNDDGRPGRIDRGIWML